MMVQAADVRDADHATTPRVNLPRDGRIALQREVRPNVIVVGDVLLENQPQVPVDGELLFQS